jgi:hypothetical protein
MNLYIDPSCAVREKKKRQITNLEMEDLAEAPYIARWRWLGLSFCYRDAHGSRART